MSTEDEIERQIKRAENKMFRKEDGSIIHAYEVSKGFVEDVNKKLDELKKVKAELEQHRKDQFSLKEAERLSGGGKLRLPTESSKQFVYDSADPYREAIDDLYDRAEKGDKKSEYMLDRLWKQILPAIKRLGREGTVITGCPRCNSGLTQDTDFCPSCNFDLIESGYKSFGDMWGVK